MFCKIDVASECIIMYNERNLERKLYNLPSWYFNFPCRIQFLVEMLNQWDVNTSLRKVYLFNPNKYKYNRSGRSSSVNTKSPSLKILASSIWIFVFPTEFRYPIKNFRWFSVARRLNISKTYLILFNTKATKYDVKMLWGQTVPVGIVQEQFSDITQNILPTF